MAAESVGFIEADLQIEQRPVLIASTKNAGRKTRYAKFIDPHAHKRFCNTCVDIVCTSIHRKTKAQGGDPRPTRSKRDVHT